MIGLTKKEQKIFSPMRSKKMKHENMIVYVAAVLAALFWGYSYVWFKQVNETYGPLTIITLRLIVASVFLSLYMFLARRNQKIERADWKLFMLLSLLEPFLYFFFESIGLTMVTATTAAIIIATIPVFTPIFTHFISREYIGYWVGLGLVLSFLGVFLVVESDGKGTNSLLGIILMFGAVFSGIVYGLTLKKLSGRYSALTVVRYQNLIGLIYFLPVFIFTEGHSFLVAKHNVAAAITLIKLGILPSTISYIFITYAIRRIGLINSNIFANLIPVFTAVIAYFELQEPLPVQKISGIVIVIAGLFISQIPQFRRLKRKF